MLKKIDDAIARVEKVMMVVFVTIMVLVVFASVVHRLFLTTIFPTGVPGAQKLALGLLVWVAFLGASLATKEKQHIRVDVVTKKLAPEARHRFMWVGGFIPVALSFLMAFLGAKLTLTEIIEWHESEGALHSFEALPIPSWWIPMAFATQFLLIGLRLLGQNHRHQEDALLDGLNEVGEQTAEGST